MAQAAGTDAWTGFRGRVARLFGRGRAGADSSAVVLERLDRTAAEVTDVGPGELEQLRERAALAWQTRFRDLLEETGGAERDAVAVGLRELVASAGQAGVGGVSASGRGIAVGNVAAHDHAVAAGRMGDVTIGNPPVPGAETS
ncbi:hypothetical protein ACFV0O_24230 [Kitasatospora sp. NPDC059577]|uniref:hypothetical protein n=1 Tax=Kitasatospora sp. NPDC059577 TaxID=3346873 RepID=UPI0036C8B24C